jgi:hypothetical protein
MLRNGEGEVTNQLEKQIADKVKDTSHDLCKTRAN